MINNLKIGDQIQVRRTPPNPGGDPIWALANITGIDSSNIKVKLVTGKFFTATGEMVIPGILEHVDWRRIKL